MSILLFIYLYVGWITFETLEDEHDTALALTAAIVWPLAASLLALEYVGERLADKDIDKLEGPK